jgi:hypothetical protein
MIDTSNESPLSETLRRFSIGTGEAATLAGCTPTEISRARAGAPIPSKLASALERLKVDTVDLNRRQAEYRRRRAASIEARAMNRCATAGVTK